MVITVCLLVNMASPWPLADATTNFLSWTISTPYKQQDGRESVINQLSSKFPRVSCGRWLVAIRACSQGKLHAIAYLGPARSWH